MSPRFSRRAVLFSMGGVAVAWSTPVKHAFAQMDAEPWAFLTNDEARWLAAVADIFIPEDDYPSASQAGVVDYIDMQLATGYGQGQGLYLKGPFAQGTPQQGWQLSMTPAELIRSGIAAAREEIDLVTLTNADRLTWVEEFSKRADPIGDAPAQTFFGELLSLTKEGYFADPIYLGNHDYAGWRMVGFPGAHAYFTERVGDNTPTSQPPMGIAHGEMRHRAPRPIVQEG